MSTPETGSPERPPEAGSSGRQHRGVVYTLVVIASILALLATFAIWANRQLLETDTWTETSAELLEDEDIQTAISGFMVDALFSNVDAQAEIQQKLPPQLQPLAGPLAGALRSAANRLADEALQRPRVQELWEDANRNAHEKFVDVVVHGDEGDVTLDLGSIVTDLGDQVGVDVSGKLPPDKAQIEVLPQDDLSTAQDIVKLLRALAIALTVLTLALYALAIYLARGWRREVLRTIGFAFIVVGVAVLFARNLAGKAVTDSLSSTEAVKPAVSSTWEIGTSLLAAQGSGLVLYGLIIVLGAWLAGPRGFARDARRAITPILERRVIAYSALLLILLLLFWWSPTPGFQRLPTALLLIALSVVGLEFLRHQAIRDFPEETWEGASERWSASVRGRVGRGGSHS
ncbi:MAG: hypothetical protein ACRDK5_00030 [Solirubrobacterales bacterium]